MPYYIRHEGRKQGPLSDAQLKTLLARGTITKETEASFDETNWKPFGEFPDFERLSPKTVGSGAVKPSSSQPVGASDVPVAVGTNDDIYNLSAIDSILASQLSSQPSQPTVPVWQSSGRPVPKPSKPTSLQFHLDPSRFGIDPKILYAVGGGVAALVLLIVLVSFAFSGIRQAVARKAESRKAEAEFAERERHEAAINAQREEIARIKAETEELARKAERERQAAAEAERKRIAAEQAAEDAKKKTKRDEKETVQKAAAEAERKHIAAEQAAEDAKKNTKKDEKETVQTDDAEMKTEPSSQASSASSSSLMEAVSHLPSTAVIKPLLLSDSGVALRSGTIENFEPLYPLREQISLKYVSYVPNNVFSFRNEEPGTIVITHTGSSVLKLAIAENGLYWEWLSSPCITPDSYQAVNGFALAELEILQADTSRVLKTVTLFPPINRTQRFDMGGKQVVVDDIDIDFKALGIKEPSLGIVGLKNLLATAGRRESIGGDTIRYYFKKDDKEYTVDIQAMAETPTKTSSGTWRIPIATDVKIPPSAEEVAEANRIKAFIRQNAKDRSAYRSAADDYQRKSITWGEVLAWERAFQSLSSSLSSKDAAAMRKYRSIAENYRSRLDMARRIAVTESVCFNIVLVHPTDKKRAISLMKVGEQN